jgi:hypothetical protein
MGTENRIEILPRYHAESCLTMPTISIVVKILEYGDNIENGIDAQSPLADQSSKGSFRHRIEPGCNF